MTGQFDFGAPTPARPGDPDTSHHAANSVNVFAAREIHHDLIAYLRAFAGTDSKRTHEAIGLEWQRFPHLHVRSSPSGLRTRLSELVHAGVVQDSGRRALMTTGRSAVVWELTQGATT